MNLDDIYTPLEDLEKSDTATTNKKGIWAMLISEHSVRGRAVILAIGLTGNWLMVKGFDFVLYPYVMYTFGTVPGWVIMTFASLLICLLTLWFYDWSKHDWIGLETIKGLRDNQAKGKLGRGLAWALKKSDPVVLVALSIYFDPLITALYMRKGANEFNGFSARDWKIFFASLIISNLYWGLVVLAGIDIVQWIGHMVGF